MTGGLALIPADGAELAGRAAVAVHARLTGRPPDERPPSAAALCGLGASFVTLERCGALLGCVGTLEAVRPLYLDVARNAVRATADPRLRPVTASDWPALDVKVSVLSAPEPLAVTGRAEVLAALRPGLDGLILVDGGQRATFLPGVWAKLPDPAGFLAALLTKGGWPAGGWPATMRVLRYTALEFHDRAPR